MTTPDVAPFLESVDAYISGGDQHDLEVLMDVMQVALSARLQPYGGLVQASVSGLRDTIRRAHGATTRPR